MSLQLASCSQGASLNSGPLQPKPQHITLARAISGAVEMYHYEKPEVDDSLSSKVFDTYLDALDNNRRFFREPDIERFEQFRYELDDAMKRGDLSVPYEIFNTFTRRFNGNMEYVLEHITDSINYNSDVTFRYDREGQPWFKTEEEQQQYWNKRIQYDLINLRLSSDSLEKNQETLTKRYTTMKTQWDKSNSEDVFQLFLNAFSRSIDPHTQYFSANTAENFQINMSKNLEGIGATLQSEGDYTIVRQVVKGSPAEKSGQIKNGDRIVGVAQGKEGEFEDIISWRIDDVVGKIRGPKGTIVRLKIIPAAAELTSVPKVVEIVRDKIKLEDQMVKSEMKEVEHNGQAYRIGLITIPDFYINFEDLRAGREDYNSATRDVKKALRSLEEKGIDGVVVDLRGNGGGSLKEAIELSGLFIKQGPVVQVKDTRGRVEVNRDEDPEEVYTGPLAVLVNRFSASASEIFAGAIQDYQRGVIIGEQTFGKGTVQNQVSFNDLLPASKEKLGQYNITIAKFYRISGGSTQHKGVIPDITFPSAFPSEKFGESSYPTALPWDQIQPVDYEVVANLKTLLPDLRAAHEKRMESSEEYKFLEEDIKQFAAKLDSHSEVLNFEKLAKEREKEKQENAARSNALRQAQGLPFHEVEAAADGAEAPADGPSGDQEEDHDLILNEGIRIIADMITFTGQHRIAKDVTRGW